MSDFLDFVVRFSQQGLGAVNNSTRSLLGNINQNLRGTQNSARYATQSIGELNRQLDALKRRRDISVDTRQITAANREIAALEQRISSLQGGASGGGGIGSFLKGGLIAGAAIGGLMAAKQIATDSIAAAMDFGTKLKSFEVLTGSAARGRKLGSDLREMKMNSLVGGGVYQNAQTMLGFGVSEGSILKKIREIGDVGMGDTQRMSSLSLVRGQTTAAGKLMGQDLLQYINAGFNPLSVMADKWKEFGFKTKMSIGALKDLMEEGKVSSAMVDQAFTLATSKGGRFYHMMDQIGETAGGKFLKLKGAWAATQIDIGNSLMPIASMAMEAAGSFLHWMNISKTVPETLRGEKSEINTLVDSITHLNSKNEVRGLLIDKLKAKYPDLFGDLDKEKTKNEDLLKILDKVNGSYSKRIDVAEHAQIANEAKEDRDNLLDLAQKARHQVSYNKRHPDRGFTEDYKYLSFLDQIKISNSGIPLLEGNGLDNRALIDFANKAEKRAGQLNNTATTNDAYVNASNNNSLLNEAYGLDHSGAAAEKALWGDNYKKNLSAFSKEMQNVRKMYSENKGLFSGSFLNYDYTKLQGLLHPESAGDDLVKTVDNKGSKISGGGSRQLIVNLNAPMIKEQIFHVDSMDQAKKYSKDAQEEILLEILDSVIAAMK